MDRVIGQLLATRDRALWDARHRMELGRCRECEWHPVHQGHDTRCPHAIEPTGEPDALT